jgi:hypothetical protein
MDHRQQCIFVSGMHTFLLVAEILRGKILIAALFGSFVVLDISLWTFFLVLV